MFEPRKPIFARKQKNRNLGFYSPSLFNLYKIANAGWPGIYALGPGQLTFKTLMTLFLWGKKLTKTPKKTRRFWFNLQRSTPITKKPKNARMGKGKGKRATAVALIKAGSPLLKISFLPFGVLKKLKTKVQVRCGFKIQALFSQENQGPYVGFYGGEVRSYRIRRLFIAPIREEFHTQFKYLNKPWLNFYFFDFFKWRYITPYAFVKKRKGGFIKRKQWRKLVRHRLLSLVAPQGVGFVRQVLSAFKKTTKKETDWPLTWWQDFYVDSVPTVWTDYLADPECVLKFVSGSVEDRLNYIFLSDPDYFCIWLDDLPDAFIYKTHPDAFFLNIHSMPDICGFEFFDFHYFWFTLITKKTCALVGRIPKKKKKPYYAF